MRNSMDSQKLEVMKSKYQNLESKNKESYDENVKRQRDERSKQDQIFQQQQELEKVKELLASKEKELENEKTLKAKELKVAYKRLNQIQQSANEYSKKIGVQEKLLSKRDEEQQKLVHDLELKENEVKQRVKDEEQKRRDKIMKMVIQKMYQACDNGIKRAFYQLQLNVQVAKLDELENTFKHNQNNILRQQITGISKQKAKALKMLVWAKHIRITTKAFNTWKIYTKDLQIYERDFSVKDLQKKNELLSCKQ